MGLLTTGEPLNWQETKKNSNLVRKKGIEQFIRLYKTFKSRNNDSFKYGDEVEYSLIKFDHKNKRVYLLLKAHELIPKLVSSHNYNENRQTSFTPEFGDFMIEALPGTPYQQGIDSISQIETNMNLRREQIQELLDQDEFIVTCTTFPLLGCYDFTWPNSSRNQNSSIFFPDDAIFQGHPRYAISMINNRERRQTKTSINIPIFNDSNTPKPFYDELSENPYELPNHVYLDGIGAACSCLQVTFQATNIDEARLLYDQLTPMTPIILALSAASPIWRGYLTDIDVRWKVISDSLDDRTPEEKGEQPLKNDKYRIFKSRYDSVDCYLSELGSKLNDINIVKDEEFYDYLTRQGIDELMAQHISHLFIRDPLVLYREHLNSSETDTDHFENIQSTNWQSMRFKPPPSCVKNSNIGWRVEFRTTEVQITDFENAAFVSFLVLLTRVILAYKINILIPISMVDKNMNRAQMRSACLEQKFFFKQDIFRDNDCKTVKEMTINEIFNGSNSFTGLIPLIKDYLSQLEVELDSNTQMKINSYLKLIEMKASGKLMTTAAWMRNFVTNHPKYQQDSLVSNEIAYELMWNLKQISNGNIESPLLNKIN